MPAPMFVTARITRILQPDRRDPCIAGRTEIGGTCVRDGVVDFRRALVAIVAGSPTLIVVDVQTCASDERTGIFPPRGNTAEFLAQLDAWGTREVGPEWTRAMRVDPDATSPIDSERAGREATYNGSGGTGVYDELT